MRLRVNLNDKTSSHEGAAVGVGWISSDTLLSIGDDKQLLQWTVTKGESQPLSAFKPAFHPVSLDSLIHSTAGKTTNLILIGTSDGKLNIISTSGKAEKSVDGHEGAVLCVRWARDASGFLSAGEDGEVKLWSRTAMLRSVLVQLGRPVYGADWNGDATRVVYSAGEHCFIKSLRSQSQPIKWKAHEGVVLCVAWSDAVDQIVTGGEDCRYRVWDSFGRALYSSNAHVYPITAVSWNPEGELFAIGAFNVLRLCDKAGWSHSVDREKVGSIYALSWSPDGTQIAGATASGQIVVANVIDKRMWWHNLEAVQTQNTVIDLRDVLSDVSRERLEMRDRVTRLQLGFEHLVVATTKQIYIFSAKNWNTPIIDDLKEGSVSLIVLCEKYFLVVESGIPRVYSYEGRVQCTLRHSQQHNNQSEPLTSRTVALSNDVVVVRDRTAHNVVELHETKTGKIAGDGKITHSADVVEVAINQCGSLTERRVAFVDSNAECFIALVNTYSAVRRCEKIGSMISHIHFNNTTNMLAGFHECKVQIWTLPEVVFTDRDLLPRTTVQLDSEDMGKSAFIVGFIGNGVAVRRADGCLVLCYVPPFLSGLIRCVGESHWDRGMRLCRTAKEDYLWATLAGLAAAARNYHVAEIAYGELLDVEKVWFLETLRNETHNDVKSAQSSLFNGNMGEAEATFLKSGRIFRAIMLNIRLFKFERALELAVKHKTHVDTVLGYRQRYLEELGQKESDQRFLKQLANYEIDWPHIREQIQNDEEKDRTIK